MEQAGSYSPTISPIASRSNYDDVVDTGNLVAQFNPPHRDNLICMSLPGISNVDPDKKADFLEAIYMSNYSIPSIGSIKYQLEFFDLDPKPFEASKIGLELEKEASKVNVEKVENIYVFNCCTFTC